MKYKRADQFYRGVFYMAGPKSEKKYALDLDREEWAGFLAEMNQPKFRADQIVQWLWQKRVYDAEEMTNLSKPLRDGLTEQIDFQLPVLIKEQRSSDGTRKYLWQLRDGQTVESVLMKHGDRLTACVSTQVGCPLQCIFCATGLSGYVRNLSAGEIAAQFLAMEKTVGRDIGNVVYMGMGEPFLNTENVLKSVRMLSDEKMRNLGIRHFTISTSGLLPGIIALAKSGLGVRLAVSLHAAADELRGQLMPISQKYPLAELRETMEEYQRITGDRITIEYALLGGVNDSVESARALVRYLKGIHVFINLIPFNAVDDRFEKPAAEAILKFRKVLETAGFEAEIRHEYGADIEAACGQLRRKTMAGEPCRLDSRSGFKPSAAPVMQEPKKEPKPKAAAAGEGTPRADKRQAVGIDAGGKRPPVRKPGGPAEGRGGSKQRPGGAGRGSEDGVRKRGKDTADKKTREKDLGKASSADKRPFGKTIDSDKRRKSGEPQKERYRSGKMKEERPSHKGLARESAPEREAKWYDGAAKPRRPKAKKASAQGVRKTSMTGAERKSKPASKPKTRKKK